MLLTISKEDNRFIVDDRSRPGTPRVGWGRTMKEAIGDYFHGNQTELNIEFEVHGTAKPAEQRRRRRELFRR
jgi:predicted ATP-grasp superfamily ATP-dependent carboligase